MTPRLLEVYAGEGAIFACARDTFVGLNSPRRDPDFCFYLASPCCRYRSHGNTHLKTSELACSYCNQKWALENYSGEKITQATMRETLRHLYSHEEPLAQVLSLEAIAHFFEGELAALGREGLETYAQKHGATYRQRLLAA